MKTRMIARVAGGALFGLAATMALAQTVAPAAGGGSGNDGAEACSHSPICAWGKGRNAIAHELRAPDMSFTFAYPFALPEGLTGGVSALP